MATPPLIGFHVLVSDGLRAWVAIDDVPLLPSPMMGSFSTTSPINHRVAEGVNTATFHLDLCKDWSRQEGMEVTKSDRWFVFQVLRERPEPGVDGELDHETLVDYVLPAAWEALPPERRRFPFSDRVSFDLGKPLARMTQFESPPVQTPCEGTAELHEAVRALHDAHAKRDRDKILDLCDIKVQDFARALGGRGGTSAAAQQAELAELVAAAPVFEPLAPDQLHFEARAGGRVVHVSRRDGRPVLFAKGRELAYKTDLLLVQTPKGFRLV